MDNYSFPFQEPDDIPMITCPDFTPWDDVMNLVSYRENAQEMIDFSSAEKGKHQEITYQGGAYSTDQKKMVHRDTEKQRRQEMASLYASLRSVLPAQNLEFDNKGKRSVSDQIHEATMYIRCLQRRIKVLKARRDRVKTLISTNEFQESGERGRVFSTSVERCFVGIKVVISGHEFMLPEDGLLARVLKLLSEEGLDVVCCNWTKFDGKLHYVIRSEVLDYVASIDLQALRRKLNGVIFMGSKS